MIVAFRKGNRSVRSCWILGNNRTYLWKNGLETIPDHLWCARNECTSMGEPRVMLNLLCHRNSSLICLGTRLEWKPAPYICKRIRPIDGKDFQ